MQPGDRSWNRAWAKLGCFANRRGCLVAKLYAHVNSTTLVAVSATATNAKPPMFRDRSIRYCPSPLSFSTSRSLNFRTQRCFPECVSLPCRWQNVRLNSRVSVSCRCQPNAAPDIRDRLSFPGVCTVTTAKMRLLEQSAQCMYAWSQ
jgi:hypothetical protein